MNLKIPIFEKNVTVLRSFPFPKRFIFCVAFETATRSVSDC